MTKHIAIGNLATFMTTVDWIINGAVGIADFTDAAVRALLVDQIQDEVNELAEKWGIKGGYNDNKEG